MAAIVSRCSQPFTSKLCLADCWRVNKICDTCRKPSKARLDQARKTIAQCAGSDVSSWCTAQIAVRHCPALRCKFWKFQLKADLGQR